MTRPLRRLARRWASVVVVLVAALGAVLLTPWLTSGGDGSIRSDGVGYHAWTRAILDRDLSFCRYGDLVGALSYRDEARGVCQNKYPPGLALLRLPVMAPLVDRSPDAPLISPAEHRANDLLAAGALVGVAVLLAGAGRRLGLRPVATHVAVLAVVFGTGLFHYGTYDASFTHVWSALGFAVLLNAWSRASAGAPGGGLLAVYAVTAFFLVLIRQTNLLVLVVLSIAVLIGARARRIPTSVLAAAAGAVLALGVQLAYNRYATGEWRLSSYGNEPFLLDRPMQRSVLLSYERGLLTWYPVVGVALVAGLAVRRARPWALTVLACVLVLTTLYGFWFSWMLGGGFGHRGFVELAPLVFLPLAGALDAASGRARRVVLAATVACVAATASLMLGYWSGAIFFAGTSPQTYWAHVVGEQSWLGPLARAVRAGGAG